MAAQHESCGIRSCRFAGLAAALFAVEGIFGFPGLAPRPAGEYEIRIVPETVDLVRHAELCINAITRTTDSEEGYNSYLHGNLISNPPRLSGPSQLHGKFWESLALMRLMTGNLANMNVDDAWASRLDSLSQTLEKDTVNGGRILALLALFYRLSEDAKWLTCGNRIVENWRKQVVQREDFAYFPPTGNYALDPTGTRRLEEYKADIPAGWPATFSGWALQGLAVYFRETRYEPALELAGKLARFLRYHGGVFDGEGRFLARHDGYLGPKTALHFHHNANSAVALVEYAIASGKREYAEFGRKCYEYARSTGNASVGFFPEYIGNFPDDRRGAIDCEGCCVADMVFLALKLTEAGAGDYWEDADRYVRNMLTQMQMKSCRWIEEAARSMPPAPLKSGEDRFQAAERLVGSFAGWSGPNQFRVHGIGIMQCCLGNCARALYYVWDRMLREDPGQLTVELMLNRSAAMANIASDLPYAGRIRIHLKKDGRLRLRRPGWLDPATVRIASADSAAPLPFKVDGSYLVTEKAPAGSDWRIDFNMPEKKLAARVGHLEANLTLRGNEIVEFSPPGETYPYWQDKPVGRGVIPETCRTYFIPSKRVHW